MKTVTRDDTEHGKNYIEESEVIETFDKLRSRIADIERRLGITPETDCPEGYRELGPDEVLQECDLWKMAHGDGSLFNTVNAGKRVSEITPYSQKRYFRKLAAPESAATAEPEPQDCPDGCLPFDLEKALAGHPVKRRDGQVATYYGPTGREKFPHCFEFGQCGTGSFTDAGRYYLDKISTHDLFLVAPKPSPREIVGSLIVIYRDRQEDWGVNTPDWNHFQRKIDTLDEVLRRLAEAGY